MIDGAEAAALAQVVGIDVLLAGDNAVAIGALAAGLAPQLQRRALVIGIAVAVALRIALSLGVSWLFGLPGVTLIGGGLLLLVAGKLARDILRPKDEESSSPRFRRSFGSAVLAIVATDISLSLDNVLGVAAAARGHPLALVIGLVLSIVLMGVAAGLIARLIERRPWLAWIGVALIALVAVRMIVAGTGELGL